MVPPPVRTWFLTYPQNDASPSTLLSELSDVDEIEEYLIAQEEHKDEGKHLHAYVKFKNGVKKTDAPTVFNVLDKSGNYQPARSCKNVIKYCSKDGNYIANFDLDNYLNKKKKLCVKTIQTKSAREALIDGDITIASIRNYNLARSILVQPYEHDDVRGLWIWGPPGTGKSHAVRAAFPDYYDKAQNKWFDGYEGQKTICIDDYDDKKGMLAHYIKRWADKYACAGEIKGGSVQLCHTTFVITSNYSIEQMFAEDDAMYHAISRRFRVVHKVTRDQSILETPASPSSVMEIDTNSAFAPGFSLPE